MRTTQTLPVSVQQSRQPLTKPFRNLLLAVDRPFAAWQKRRQFRQALRRMPPHLLDDIGLTEDQARDEAGKPFWQA